MFIYALALVFTLSVILVKGEFNPKKSVRQRAGLEGSPAALHFVSRELLTDVTETATTRDNRRRQNCKCGQIGQPGPPIKGCFCVTDGACSSGSICLGDKQSWLNCVTGDFGCCHKIPSNAVLPVQPGFGSGD